MQNIFKVINMAGQHAFTDDNFSLEKSGWIKKTGSKLWQKKDRTTHLQRLETLRHTQTADLGVPMMKTGERSYRGSLFSRFLLKKMEFVSRSIVGLTLATIKQGYRQ